MDKEYRLEFDENGEPTHLVGGSEEHELQEVGWEVMLPVIMEQLGVTREEAVKLVKKYRLDKVKWFRVVKNDE